MVTGNYIRQRWLEPLIEKQRKERYARNFANGFAEGRARVNAEWEAWYARLLKAKAAGEPFNEPTPSDLRANSESNSTSVG